MPCRKRRLSLSNSAAITSSSIKNFFSPTFCTSSRKIPLHPAYKNAEPLAVRADAFAILLDSKLCWAAFRRVGHEGEGFSLSIAKGPRITSFIEPFRLADRLVTNREWMEFIADGGYRNPLLWLSEGWTKAQSEGWTAPLYWQERDDQYWTMTLRGAQPVDPGGARLPRQLFRSRCFCDLGWAATAD